MKKQVSTKKSLASIVLGFEVVVIFLTGLTIFGLSLLTPAYLAIIVSGVIVLIDFVAIGLMRKSPAGMAIGHVLHVIYFLPAIILPSVAIVALIFGTLWMFAIFKGNQIDRMRAEHFKKN